MVILLEQVVTEDILKIRSSRPEVFCKNGVLRNFTKFTGKHLCQSLVFNKVAGLRPATLLKKKFWQRSSPMNFVKFLRIPFHIEQLWWLFLDDSCSEKIGALSCVRNSYKILPNQFNFRRCYFRFW